ncbi:hypothetical protein DID88_009840 [Monilinia fructigena]|uniref:Uncharacterized protein n=1 Tax=Monilinia fructigena TaxID=38457 RepID=A0A395ILI8_9HELO|nr:hypothetical protein DID88_009840 [Monilinia fructigena]
MTDYSTKTVPNGFLSPPTETKFKNSQCRRSASVPGSERSARSSLSRITLVEDNAQIALHTSLEDSDSIISIRPTGVPKNPSSDMDGSPWVLPVLVLSSRRDTDKQPVPKRAKCTIDTGNMQGNIVSREFVEKVLEYPESNFVPLTAEEKEGGFGVTGHKLVPQGAIYLTCTRVANKNDLSMDKEEEHLQTIWLKRKESFMKKEVELMDAGVDFENDQDWKDLKNTHDIAKMYYLIRKARGG